MTTEPVVAGIDVGGTKVLGRALVGDDPTSALATARLATPVGTDALLDTIAAVVGMLAEDPAVGDRGGLAAVGIGVPGLVDDRGVLRFAPHLPGVTALDVGPALEHRLGLTVRVDNDGNSATWCEAVLGAARDVSEAMLITLGTGIGGGLICGGRLYRGANGFAGEPGHIVVDPVGPMCPCGRRGCWEQFGSGSGLGRLGREAAALGKAPSVVALAGTVADIRGEHVSDAAVAGHADAVAVLHGFAWWVALGIANLVNVLDPEVVMVGGGLAALGDTLIDPIRESYEGMVLAPTQRPPVRIVAASFGPEAGAIGAGLLARERVG